jgi:hypothetical protein
MAGDKSIFTLGEEAIQYRRRYGSMKKKRWLNAGKEMAQ